MTVGSGKERSGANTGTDMPLQETENLGQQSAAGLWLARNPYPRMEHLQEGSRVRPNLPSLKVQPLTEKRKMFWTGFSVDFWLTINDAASRAATTRSVTACTSSGSLPTNKKSSTYCNNSMWGGTRGLTKSPKIS